MSFSMRRTLERTEILELSIEHYGVQVFSPLKDHLHKWRPYFLQEMLKGLWNENGSSDSVCFAAPLLSHNKHWAHQTESLSGKPVLLILQHIVPLCLADYYHMPKQAWAFTVAFGVRLVLRLEFFHLERWKTPLAFSWQWVKGFVRTNCMFVCDLVVFSYCDYNLNCPNRDNRSSTCSGHFWVEYCFT